MNQFQLKGEANTEPVNYYEYQFKPGEVYTTVMPVTFAGTTIAKTNVLDPITLPATYDNSAL